MASYKALREVVIQTDGGPQHIKQGQSWEFTTDPGKHWECLDAAAPKPKPRHTTTPKAD